MNKSLSILLIVVIALGIIGGGAFWLFKKSTAPVQDQAVQQDDEASAPELNMDQRPYVSLTPSVDGHNLHLTAKKIPANTISLEYTIKYTNAQGVNQGAFGEGKTNGSTSLDRDVLLGSCSSGKCKYDEGVEDGTLTIALRDGDGKLVAKTMTTPFHLMKAPSTITLSGDSTFSLKLDKPSKADFYLAMQTIGIPSQLPGTLSGSPVGVFTAAKTPGTGMITMSGTGNTYVFDGTAWTQLANNKATKLGIFAKSS